MEEFTSLTSSTQDANMSSQLIPRKPGKTENATVTEIPSRLSGQSPRFDVKDGRSLQQITQARKSNFRLRIWNKAWTLEISSCLLSGTALVAIIITLLVHQGRPLPEWPHLISVNSLISVFTTILKAALIMPVAEGLCQLKWQHFRKSRFIIDLNRYDLASRGPWGSLLFLFKARKQSLALVGALITLAALAIDPFSQQIIRYFPCYQIRQNAQAAIPRVNNLTFPLLPGNSGTSSQEFSTIGSIYQGLLNPPSNATSTISFDCVTGNCTFPEDGGATFSSIGFCYSFLDITETVSVDRDGYSLSLPSGLVSSDSLSIMAIDDGALGAFEALMFLDKGLSDGKLSYFAFRASFFPCVKTYAANISNFILEERIISSISVPYLSEGLEGDEDGYYALITNRTLRNGVWHDCKPTSERTADNPVIYVPLDSQAAENISTGIATAQYYAADCAWSVELGAVVSLAQEFSRLFNNQTYDEAEWPKIAPLHLIRLFNNGAANSDSANRYLSGMVDTLTANMRQSQFGQPYSSVLGTVYELQTCISVQWVWLSLPAALFLLTVAFLAMIILQNSHSSAKLPAWKSSELALLFHGFANQDVLRQYHHLETEEDMNRVARLVQARLTKNFHQGWTFEHVDYGESETDYEGLRYT